MAAILNMNWSVDVKFRKTGNLWCTVGEKRLFYDAFYIVVELSR